jgi:hypothetical protein
MLIEQCVYTGVQEVHGIHLVFIIGKTLNCIVNGVGERNQVPIIYDDTKRKKGGLLAVVQLLRMIPISHAHSGTITSFIPV